MDGRIRGRIAERALIHSRGALGLVRRDRFALRVEYAVLVLEAFDANAPTPALFTFIDRRHVGLLKREWRPV